MDVRTDGRGAVDMGSLAVPVLKLVSEARNEHGMRQHDWNRYRCVYFAILFDGRQYCTVKTRRLRKALRLTHTDAEPKRARSNARGKNKRSARTTPAAQSKANKGSGNTFVRKTIDREQVRDVRPLELLLFETEHCWSSAEEVWAQQEPDTPRSALRRHCIARGRRALQNVERLEALVAAMREHIDCHSRAQAAAYCLLVRGSVSFLKAHWDEALRFCSAARQLLMHIAACSESSRDEALASSFVDAVDAQIRFAAYSLGDASQDMDEVAAQAAPASVCEELSPGYAALVAELQRESQSSASDRAQSVELHWHGDSIAIRHVELLDAVTRVRDEEQVLADALRRQSASEHAAGEKTKHSERPQGVARERISHAARNAKRRGTGQRSLRLAQTQRADRGELDPFDRVLGALTDAEEVVRQLVTENAAALQKSHSARYEAAGRDLRRAHEFVLYRLLSVRIARNARLVQQVQTKAAKRQQKASAQAQRHHAAHVSDAAGAQRGDARTQRRPGRSGTLALRRAAQTERVERAQRVGSAKADRRSSRAVPGLAKLLESIDSSLLVIGGLVIVEGEPDVSSLMEAKRFWYCALQLLHLARAFSLHGLDAEAMLLLHRGELYLRQARQTLELAAGAEEEDGDFAPQLLSSPAALEELSADLSKLRRRIEVNIYLHERDGGTSHARPAPIRDTKAGQTLYYHAQRHVELDAENLDLAKQLDPARFDELAAEYGGAERAPRSQPAPSAEASIDADPEPADALLTSSATYDPANASLEEEEERLAAQAKQRSWLGGWFSRK